MVLGSVEEVRLATASGAPWLTLLVHVGAGMAALVSGFVAVAVAKGGAWHRRAGIVFVYAMIVMGLFGATVAVIEGKVGSVIGGTFAAYLVFTAFTTVRPVGGRLVAIASTVVGFTLALLTFWGAAIAWSTPGASINGVPDGMKYFITTIAWLAAIGDLRVVIDGGIAGSRRLGRHLWRMCFSLFIASGSFFLGQIATLPEPLRIVPVLSGLAISPLIVLIYWMWRVRLRKSLRGMTVRVPESA